MEDIMQTGDTTPDYGVRRFVCKSGGEWLAEAAVMPDPVPLCGSLWHSGEVACLFADTNMGKSLLAVQIGMDIAQKHRCNVLYFDFEMSMKQYQKRYSDPDSGRPCAVPFGFKRVEFSQEVATDSLDDIVADIEHLALTAGASHIIIDNITWLCRNLEEGKSAIALMQLLCGMKKRTGISILVLAHTPKRPAGAPLTINSLGGSRHLSNFMDSVFALGKDFSQEGEGGRYVKQLKARLTEIEYGAGHVIRYEIRRDDGMLGLAPLGYCTEAEALADAPAETQASDADAVERIQKMRREGASIRAIAAAVERSKAYVHKIIRNSDDD